MLLYTSPRAPNPRRVHVYLAEKGIEIETRLVDLGQREQFSDAYRAINPDAVVPTLLLDDGTAVGESLAICRCLEAMFPHPPLFGRDPGEIGQIESWLRQLEIQLYLPIQDAYRNSRPGFAGRALPGVEQGVDAIPELVARSSATARRMLDKLDRRLHGRQFVMGDGLTMPDIVGVVSIDFGLRTKMQALADLSVWPNLAGWHAEVSERPAFADH
jgi:glutathione S-transferase